MVGLSSDRNGFSTVWVVRCVDRRAWEPRGRRKSSAHEVLPVLSLWQVIQAGGGQVQNLIALGRVLVRRGRVCPQHEARELPMGGVDGQRGGMDAVMTGEPPKLFDLPLD